MDRTFSTLSKCAESLVIEKAISHRDIARLLSANLIHIYRLDLLDDSQIHLTLRVSRIFHSTIK